MLDITLLRKDLDGVVARLLTRKNPQPYLDVDAFRALEAERKTIQTRTEELQAQRNALSKQIGQLKAKGEPVPDLNAVAVSDPINAVEFIFPHYFLLPIFSSMSSYRIRPLTPETCLFEIWSLVLRPDGEDYDTPKAPTMLPYDSEQFPEIPMQDYSNLPRQQRGLEGKDAQHMVDAAADLLDPLG